MDVNAPQFFTRKRQQVFEYIWDNPGANSKEIHFAVWGDRAVSRNILTVHIYHIRMRLKTTDYKLGHKPVNPSDGWCINYKNGRPTYRWKIIYKPKEDSIPNANLNVTTIVP
jgi:hypothetical protein